MFLTLLPLAFPCGGFFGPVGQVVSSDAQQAILTQSTDTLSVEYRVRYTGDAQQFAWVLPVPGTVDTVEEGNDQDFTDLENQTAPNIFDDRTTDYDGGPACGCGAGMSNGDVQEEMGVTVLGKGFAGEYAYTILSATNGDNLQSWLSDNGFDVATASAVIDAYVADPRGIEFVAVTVRPDAATPDSATGFKPLRITYGAGSDGALHLDYPAMMASTSTVESQRLELYVLGDSNAFPGGIWSSASLGNSGIVDIESDEDPNEWYTQALTDAGGTNAHLVEVYRGDFVPADGGKSRFVSRFDTIVSPATEASDIPFTFTGKSNYLSTELHITATADSAAGLFLVFGIGSLGIGFRRRR